ncbi:MAG: hypothetical protein ABR573_04000 [Candidatus Dormibacteria bacterium]
MGNRGVQVLLVVVVLVLGVGSAVAVNSSRSSKEKATATASPSPTLSPSPSPSATASASPSASPSTPASPEPAPSVAPTTAPAPAPTANGGTADACALSPSGGSGTPPEISAGRSYNYCGPRAFVAHATDSRETASGVCAGINESTQSFPGGYEGVFFVGVQFPDGKIVSAGYVRDAAGRHEFGSIQNSNGTQRNGVLGSDPGAGSHTYCVNRSGSGWATTRDGIVIYTAPEGAATLQGGTIKFDSDVAPVGSPAPQAFTFTVPGFHDILVSGAAPRQLLGAAFYS